MAKEELTDLEALEALLDAGNRQIRQTFDLYLEMLKEFQRVQGRKQTNERSQDEQQSG